MRRIGAAIVLATLLTAGLAALASAATTSQRPPLREFEGRVVSINREAKTFRLHDSERGTKRIRVTRNTRFERVNGLAGLSVGQRAIEVKTRRKVDGAWIAIEVEKSGGGGEHGGRDDDDGDDDRDDDD
jgi:Domain of unknown function (DUF5666)